MRLLLLSLLCVALTACAPPGGVARLPETGIAGAFSRQAVVARSGHTVMVGRVFVLRQGDGRVLTAELGQLAHSGQGRLRMEAAWDGGTELAFDPVGRSEPLCASNGRCRGYRTGYRTGHFAFSPAAFEAAGRDGFRALVIGPDGSVEVRYPPDLFTEAAARARLMGLWPP